VPSGASVKPLEFLPESFPPHPTFKPLLKTYLIDQASDHLTQSLLTDINVIICLIVMNLGSFCNVQGAKEMQAVVECCDFPALDLPWMCAGKFVRGFRCKTDI